MGKSKEDIAVEVVRDSIIEMQMSFFNFWISNKPEEEARLRPHFEEAVLYESQMSDDSSWDDVMAALPQNEWVKLWDFVMKTVSSRGMSRGEISAAKQDFQRKVDKRMKGTHVN